MKKVITILATILVFFSLQPNTLAAEDKPIIPYFGVGANVTEIGDGSFVVKTEGAKAEEGFVFTPKESFTSTKISFQITLKGTGTVLLKISETDPRGRFIKEKTIEVVLTEDWTTHVLPFELASTISQIDVSVVTKDATRTEFSYKDLKIIQE
ncbi:Carbohydrate binding protein OS=Ureibacillus acetophenoni OX=614649 GN=SAMN05877842_106168 PE=4 SV=1 [Ureibacillus acetophenoni]